MKYDTGGNAIYEPIQNCRCGLTSGCNKCNPAFNGVSYSIIEKEKDKKLDSFIGIITDEEAERMKDKIKRRKRQGFCVNCGKVLEPFCSRYCQVEYET